jgi:hypothetical protein
MIYGTIIGKRRATSDKTSETEQTEAISWTIRSMEKSPSWVRFTEVDESVSIVEHTRLRLLLPMSVDGQRSQAVRC